MRKLSESRVQEIWDQRLREGIVPPETFNIYVANPFCAGQCSYCQYNSVSTEDNKSAYERYYDSFLPKQFETFSHLFEKRLPDTIYFGGGSPNAMTSDLMESIFAKIPRFNEIPNKVFENDPKLMNPDKLSVLTDVDFSYVSFGVQSLDHRTLEAVNREPCDEDFLREVIRLFQESGTRVNCDLMVYVGDKALTDDVDRVVEDAERLYTEFSPDIITIYPCVQRAMRKQDEVGEEGMGRITLKFRQKIADLIRKYELHGMNLNPVSSIDEIDSHFQAPRLTDDLRVNLSKQYNCTSPPGVPDDQNVLGLGGYAQHRPYSYLGRDLIYETANRYWDPVYLLRQNRQ